MDLAASSASDGEAGDVWDLAGTTGRWEAGTSQMRLQIPLRQSLLTGVVIYPKGVIFLSKNLLGKRKEEEFNAKVSQEEEMEGNSPAAGITTTV